MKTSKTNLSYNKLSYSVYDLRTLSRKGWVKGIVSEKIYIENLRMQKGVVYKRYKMW